MKKGTLINRSVLAKTLKGVVLGSLIFACFHMEGYAVNIYMVDDYGEVIVNPLVNMNTSNFSFQPHTVTGTFGVSTQKIMVSNQTTTQGWSVTLSASAPTAVWSDGGSNTIDFNDSTGEQLTVDPSGATVVRDDQGSISGINMGSSASFEQGVVDSITLFTSTSAEAYHDYEFTGIALSQWLPALKTVGTYQIDFVLTVS